MYYSENRGSEWHKWDLHVHTPASSLNNQFGYIEETWDEYVKVLFTTALQHDVVAPKNVIIANQQGQIDDISKSYRFEYVNGPIEMSFIDTDIKNELYSQGVREHVCDILEGGEEGFETRELKYGFKR